MATMEADRRAQASDVMLVDGLMTNRDMYVDLEQALDACP
jgi:hypothetical protein